VPASAAPTLPLLHHPTGHDPRRLTVADDRRDYGEDRFITIGFLDARMVVAVWTARRGAGRIISLRESH
jgi:hypothetical protein